MTESGPELYTFDEPDEELQGRVKSELAPGERLLWAARRRPLPISQRRFVIADLTFVVLAGVSVASFAGVVRHPLGRAEVEWLLTLGFISSIAAFVTGLFALAMRSGRRRQALMNATSAYALTDRRAIFWLPGYESNSIEVHSYFRGDVVRVHRVEFPDGSGGVYFSLRNQTVGCDGGSPQAYDRVVDVRRVEDMARRTLVAAD